MEDTENTFTRYREEFADGLIELRVIEPKYDYVYDMFVIKILISTNEIWRFYNLGSLLNESIKSTWGINFNNGKAKTKTYESKESFCDAAGKAYAEILPQIKDIEAKYFAREKRIAESPGIPLSKEEMELAAVTHKITK